MSHDNPNREDGDWYQYLDRQGRPTINLVPRLGVKDPFHLPRALIYGVKTLRRLAESAPQVARAGAWQATAESGA